MELVGSGSGPRSVDTLFGFNIIGKSMFTVRESMRVHARASVPYKGDGNLPVDFDQCVKKTSLG
jgi:hypothetical protein